MFQRVSPLLLSLALALASHGCCKQMPDLGKESEKQSAEKDPSKTLHDQDSPSASNKQSDAAKYGPSTSTVMPFQVGQWSRYRMTRKGKSDVTITYRVVGGSANSPDLEVTMDDQKSPNVIKLDVTFTDRHKLSTWKVRNASVKLGNKPPIVLPAMARKRVEQVLTDTIITSPPLQGPQEDCSAPAGKFKSCFKANTDVEIIGLESASTLLLHSSVPILATVRSEFNDGEVMELLAFGLSGSPES
jgi:hypothetical protein